MVLTLGEQRLDEPNQKRTSDAGDGSTQRTTAPSFSSDLQVMSDSRVIFSSVWLDERKVFPAHWPSQWCAVCGDLPCDELRHAPVVLVSGQCRKMLLILDEFDIEVGPVESFSSYRDCRTLGARCSCHHLCNLIDLEMIDWVLVDLEALVVHLGIKFLQEGDQRVDVAEEIRRRHREAIGAVRWFALKKEAVCCLSGPPIEESMYPIPNVAFQLHCCLLNYAVLASSRLSGG